MRDPRSPKSRAIDAILQEVREGTVSIESAALRLERLTEQTQQARGLPASGVQAPEIRSPDGRAGNDEPLTDIAPAWSIHLSPAESARDPQTESPLQLSIDCLAENCAVLVIRLAHAWKKSPSAPHFATLQPLLSAPVLAGSPVLAGPALAGSYETNALPTVPTVIDLAEQRPLLSCRTRLEREGQQIRFHIHGSYPLGELASRLSWPPPECLLNRWSDDLEELSRWFEKHQWPLASLTWNDLWITREGQLTFPTWPARVAEAIVSGISPQVPAGDCCALRALQAEIRSSAESASCCSSTDHQAFANASSNHRVPQPQEKRCEEKPRVVLRASSSKNKVRKQTRRKRIRPIVACAIGCGFVMAIGGLVFEILPRGSSQSQEDKLSAVSTRSTRENHDPPNVQAQPDNRRSLAAVPTPLEYSETPVAIPTATDGTTDDDRWVSGGNRPLETGEARLEIETEEAKLESGTSEPGLHITDSLSLPTGPTDHAIELGEVELGEVGLSEELELPFVALPNVTANFLPAGESGTEPPDQQQQQPTNHKVTANHQFADNGEESLNKPTTGAPLNSMPPDKDADSAAPPATDATRRWMQGETIEAPAITIRLQIDPVAQHWQLPAAAIAMTRQAKTTVKLRPTTKNSMQEFQPSEAINASQPRGALAEKRDDSPMNAGPTNNGFAQDGSAVLWTWRRPIMASAGRDPWGLIEFAMDPQANERIRVRVDVLLGKQIEFTYTNAATWDGGVTWYALSMEPLETTRQHLIAKDSQIAGQLERAKVDYSRAESSDQKNLIRRQRKSLEAMKVAIETLDSRLSNLQRLAALIETHGAFELEVQSHSPIGPQESLEEENGKTVVSPAPRMLLRAKAVSAEQNNEPEEQDDGPAEQGGAGQ